MNTYGIWIFGKPWSQHGTLMLDGLTTEQKAIDLVRNVMKNDSRIIKAEVWATDEADGMERVFTKLKERDAA